jgi:anti-sigma regulatory factor (Ser/Thr protein kinase)
MGSASDRKRSWSRTLRAGPTTATEARWFLYEVVEHLDPNVDVLAAALLTTELASNAARHGKEPIEVDITRADPEVRISVVDHGVGFDPNSGRMQATEGGGMKLVGALASDWGVGQSDSGTEVWFRI